MSSVQKLTRSALESGFVRSDCVHDDHAQHLVFDYPAPLVEGQTDPFYRVHVDMAKVPCVVHIGGAGGPVDLRATLKGAIAWMWAVVEDETRN